MATSARRAFAAILSIVESAATPAVSTMNQLYAALVAATLRLFAENSSSFVTQGSPYFGLAKHAYYACDDFGMSTSSSFTAGGTGAAAFNNALTGAPGSISQTVTTTATPDRSVIMPSGNFNATLVPNNGPLTFESRCQTVTAQDGTDQWSDRWGTGDTVAAGDTTDGIYFESDRATYGDNNVRLCTSASSSRTKTTMGVAPTAGTFQRWSWVCNTGATSVQGFLDDIATGAAVTATIPTAGMAVWWAHIAKTLGTTARVVYRDYLESYQLYSTPR